jgi:hypothetical protein
MAVLLSAMHPARVSRLVLYGSYARRVWAEDYPWAQTAEERQEYTERLVNGWDWEADMRLRTPSADAAMQDWWARRMRAAATPSTVRAVMQMNDLVDVREVLPALRLPTLVLHRRHDALFDVGEAEYLAQAIPGATLDVLEGSDHFVAGDPAQLIDAIRPFVEAGEDVLQQPRVLSAVVATTGVDEADVIDALVAAGGRRRRGPDGNDVVLFDGPASAVRSARSAVLPDRPVAAGVSIAEVSVGGPTAAGPGVDLAVRLAREAVPGRVDVSSAVALLLPGSGIELVEGPESDRLTVAPT